ncbi:MAG: ABC-2 type transport system ATP-binding protein [Gammaproteobacteria bacterium]|jgi:ABC-2 type transport system ATP-binding protein
MISASHLIKRFNGRNVVDDVSLNVGNGQIFGLLGPNAAGKTTVIRMLCGLVKCDEGTVTINDMSITQAKIDLGYVAQHFGQYEELSVWENLKFYAQMYGVTDELNLASLLDRYHLTVFKHQRAGLLSGGYQRRLALACALAHDPKVIFLDEPTAGIDPVTRKLMWDDLYTLAAEGKTLFVTTHYMEEAQRCHQLAFISNGTIVAAGSPDTIKQALGEASVYTTRILYLPELRDALQDLEGMILVNQFGNELRMVVTPKLTRSKLATTISAVIGSPCSLEIDEPNLEDTFIALTLESSIAH